MKGVKGGVDWGKWRGAEDVKLCVGGEWKGQDISLRWHTEQRGQSKSEAVSVAEREGRETEKCEKRFEWNR